MLLNVNQFPLDFHPKAVHNAVVPIYSLPLVPEEGRVINAFVSAVTRAADGTIIAMEGFQIQAAVRRDGDIITGTTAASAVHDGGTVAGLVAAVVDSGGGMAVLHVTLAATATRTVDLTAWAFDL